MQSSTLSCIKWCVTKRTCLTGIITLLCVLFSSTLTANAIELLRNNDFSQELTYWRKAPGLKSWSPVSESVLDIDPPASFRKDMLWQPLNVVQPGNELFTFNVDLNRVAANTGSAVSFAVEYVDKLGGLKRAPLLPVSNTLIPEGTWKSVQRQWRCPEGAQRLTKLLIPRTGSGHLQIRTPSFSHESLGNSPLPVVTGINPASGPYNTLITITGQNFGTTPGHIYINRDGSNSDWSHEYATEASVQTWTDTSVSVRISQPLSGGELTVLTALQHENSESFSFDLTDPHFTLKTVTPPQSVNQGEPLSFDFKVTTSNGGSGYPGGIGFFVNDANDYSKYTITPETVAPGAGTEVTTTVTINTNNLPPGHYTRHLQSLEDYSYARFSVFEFDIALRGESPRASSVQEFEQDGAVESSMGLPKYRINLATLDLLQETSLFRMKTHGPPIYLNLWFLGRADARDGLFGKGWRMNYESNVIHDDSIATIFTVNGKSLRFTTNGSLHDATELAPIILTPPKGNYDKLTCYGEYFEYVEKSNKVRYRFDQTTAASTTAYLTLITDRNNQSVTLQTHLTTGEISSITDEAGRVFSFNYDGNSHCVLVEAPDGRYYTFNYLVDRISSIRDPANNIGMYSYGTDGFMSYMSIDNKQTAFTYDTRPGGTNDKYVNIVTGNDTRQTHYAFKTGEAGVTQVTDSQGNVREQHTEGGKPTITIDPTGELRQIGYEDEQPIFLADKNGTTHMEYDARNNLTRVVDQQGRATELTYDADDNLLSRADALGHTWTYEYDSNHNLKKVIDPLSKYMTFSRDSRGRIVTITDQMSNTKRIFYDNRGNPTTYTDTLNNVSTFTYDASGMRLARITNARGDYKDISYDELDHITKVEYRNAANVLLGEREHLWTVFGETEFTNELGDTFTNLRNVFGQIISVTDPFGAVTSYEYDTSGNRVETIDPLSRISNLEYDAADRVIKAIDPLNQETFREYDSSGEIHTLHDTNGNLTVWEYDSRGDLILERDALGEIRRIERDALGRPSRRFNSRGQEIQYTYDFLGRMTKKLHYASGVQYDYVYNALSDLTSVTGSDGTTTYGYTNRREVSSISYPNSATIMFTYDAIGNISTITYPDGQVVSYTYDRFNRIALPSQLRNKGGEFMGFAEPPKKITSASWAGENVTLSYDATSLPTTISRSNGVVSSLTYGAANRCLEIAHTTGTTTINGMSLQYNLAGELVQQSDSSTASFPSLNDNTGVYNALNQISSWSGNNYTYDKDGNLTGTNGRFTAEYDAENRLTSLERNGNTNTYGYNALGQRVSRTGSEEVRHYLYDKTGRLLCITDETGAVLSNIIYAGATIMAFGSSAEGYLYPLFDITGNVIALTDTGGSVLAAYRYLPFGEVQCTGSPGDNPFTYSGIYGVLDEGEGLYIMRKRFYDATLGKFLQRDPIGISGGLNLYAYSDNSPILKVDPGGENPVIALFALWAGYRIYNAVGTVGHGVEAAKKAGQTARNAKRTKKSYNKFSRQAKKLQRINSQYQNSLEEEIDRQDAMRGARLRTFNRGVDVKDNAMATAASAAQTAYHGGRFVQGVIGGTSAEPEGAAGKISEILTDGSFNRLDHEELDWENVKDPSM